MVKRKHTKYYECKLRSDKLGYSTAAGVYCTPHDVKVPFLIPYCFSSKIINHLFHVDNDKGDSGIGYYMIICHDLMVQLDLTSDFKHQVLQLYGATLHMKEPRSLLGQSDLNKREMRKVVMQTAEPASTIEATE